MDNNEAETKMDSKDFDDFINTQSRLFFRDMRKKFPWVFDLDDFQFTNLMYRVSAVLPYDLTIQMENLKRRRNIE